MKKKKGLNSRKDGMIEYDGWHISVLNNDVVEVTPNETSRIDLLTKIKFCERYAKQQHCKLRFKLFTIRDLSDLESILKVQFYKRTCNQILMCRHDMGLPLLRRSQIEIKIYDLAHEEFNEKRQVLLTEDIPYGEAEVICELVVNRLSVGSGYATIRLGQMGVFNVYITEDYRGNGYGEHLMRALFHWGRENNAESAYLTVNQENEKALSLYKKIGFDIESEICIYEKN